MRLFHIDEPGCHHISYIMPGIKLVYQMEQEFAPYLSVEFLPHRNDNKSGVILVTKRGSIRKYYNFHDPNTEKDLRKLIWSELLKDKDKHIINVTDKSGCLTDFRKMGRNKVTIGWSNKLAELKKERCCKIIRKNLANSIMEYKVLHPVYKFKTNDVRDRATCLKVRSERMCQQLSIRI